MAGAEETGGGAEGGDDCGFKGEVGEEGGGVGAGEGGEEEEKEGEEKEDGGWSWD